MKFDYRHLRNTDECWIIYYETILDLKKFHSDVKNSKKKKRNLLNKSQNKFLFFFNSLLSLKDLKIKFYRKNRNITRKWRKKEL